MGIPYLSNWLVFLMCMSSVTRILPNDFTFTVHNSFSNLNLPCDINALFEVLHPFVHVVLKLIV
jgi:hypothetical protein